jgi:hypothetical protein
VYNLYIDNTNNLNELKLYITSYKFKFLTINGFSISSSDDLGPISFSSFAYTDKVVPIRSKDLVLN